VSLKIIEFENTSQKYLLPSRYHLFYNEEFLSIGNPKEEFAITNRIFEEIDLYFSQQISRTINELLSENPERKVVVVDLAGGMESRAAKDIKGETKFNDRVTALNIDFAQKIGNGSNVCIGEAAFIPLLNSSVDIVYSRQFLPFIRRFLPEHDLQIKDILTEVARILKPGGIAFLDDEEELSGKKAEIKRQKLANELRVSLEARDSVPLIRSKRHHLLFWSEYIATQKFLVMQKLRNNYNPSS
jgi:SAM-dependent methyltransferase